MGDGFGHPHPHPKEPLGTPKSRKHHQPSSDDNPATTHSGGVSINSEQVSNPGCPNSGEELPSPTLPGVNALNKEINSIPKLPTAHNYPTDYDMQLNDIDSDILNVEIRGNISDAITPNLITPTHMELNGEIIGGITQSVPPSHTELKGEYLGTIDANQVSSSSDPHVPRKWKRLEPGPHALDASPNTKITKKKKNKRNRDDGGTDQRELPCKKMQLSMSES